MYYPLGLIDYGKVTLNLKELMDSRGISINQMSQMSQVKYEIVKKYYNNENYSYTGDILAKFCFVLQCDISDILTYIPSKVPVK